MHVCICAPLHQGFMFIIVIYRFPSPPSLRCCTSATYGAKPWAPSPPFLATLPFPSVPLYVSTLSSSVSESAPHSHDHVGLALVRASEVSYVGRRSLGGDHGDTSCAPNAMARKTSCATSLILHGFDQHPSRCQLAFSGCMAVCQTASDAS